MFCPVIQRAWLLNRCLNDIGNPPEQKAFVLAPGSRGENHTQQLALRVGPSNRPAGAAVAVGSIRGQIAESVPRRRRVQPPAQTPGMTESLILVRSHGLNRGPAQDAFSLIYPPVEEHLQEDAEVVGITVHASPR